MEKKGEETKIKKKGKCHKKGGAVTPLQTTHTTKWEFFAVILFAQLKGLSFQDICFGI